MNNKNIAIGTFIVVLLIIIIGLAAFWRSSDTPGTDQTGVGTSTDTTTGVNNDESSTPGAPTLSVGTGGGVTVSASTALVTGQVTPNGAATNYWYEYGVTNALGSKTSVQALGSAYVPLYAPAYLSALKSNTLYYYRLVAENRFSSVKSPIYSFTTNSDKDPVVTLPGVETDPATDIARTTAVLNGGVNPKGNLTSYWFEYGTTDDFGHSSKLISAGSGNVTVDTEIAIGNLAPVTKYYFRMNAQGPYGTVIGKTQTFTTEGPAGSEAPDVVTDDASFLKAAGARLNGEVNPNGATTSYWFEYGTDKLSSSVVGKTTTAGTVSASASNTVVSMDVTALKPDTVYYYRVVAKNGVDIMKGNVVSFKTSEQ